MVKTLLENWRRFISLNERINCLDPDSGKRFIADTLTEINDESHNISIPPEELQKIKKWGELEGEPNFLGSGSKGSAYKFGNKVLKITSDPNEAQAAAALIGKSHPNVYEIYVVARRTKENMQKSQRAFKHLSYIVVYEFLDYPNRLMLDATSHLHDVIRTKEGKQLYYFWDSSYLEMARSLLEDFSAAIKADRTILGEPLGKYDLAKEKIEEIAPKLGWSETQKNIFNTFYGSGLDGMRAKDINSPEGIEEYLNNNINNPRHQYFHQLALGLTYLFDNNIIFNDLKTSNVMEKNDQVAIIDIGYSTVRSDETIPEIS